MNPVTATLIRSVLKAGGGYLVGSGLADDATAELITGGLFALVGVLWGVWQRRQQLPRAAGIPVLVAALALSVTACKTTPDQVRTAAGFAKVAAYVGASEALLEHPDWKPGFELARQDLALLADQDQVDFVTVLAIVRRLPVKELRSERATLYITAATLLLEQYGQDVLPLDQVKDLRPIVVALRDGLALALYE